MEGADTVTRRKSARSVSRSAHLRCSAAHSRWQRGAGGKGLGAEPERLYLPIDASGRWSLGVAERAARVAAFFAPTV